MKSMKNSSTGNIISGLFLSPTLFNIFINDIPILFTKVLVIMLIFIFKKPEKLNSKVKTCMKQLTL